MAKQQCLVYLSVAVIIIQVCRAGCPMRTFNQLVSTPSPAPASPATSPQNLTPSLQFGFYDTTCPTLNDVVSKTIASAASSDSAILAPLLRLFFHDCFVQGCDASVLLDSTDLNVAEKDERTKNFSLRKFEVIDDIKQQLENSSCAGVVSCADVLALAAVNAVEQAGGPHIDIELGRRDALDSFAAATKTQIPAPTLPDVSSLLNAFENVGLDLTDLVALSGGHTIGQAHCSSVGDRFSDSGQQNSSFDAYTYNKLKAYCTADNTILVKDFPQNNRIVVLDAVSATQFDNQYFLNVAAGKGVLTSDLALMTNETTAKLVTLYATNQSAFFQQFAESMRRMGKINFLAGTQGQVRRQCRVRNSNNPNGDFNPISTHTCAAQAAQPAVVCMVVTNPPAVSAGAAHGAVAGQFVLAVGITFSLVALLSDLTIELVVGTFQI